MRIKTQIISSSLSFISVVVVLFRLSDAGSDHCEADSEDEWTYRGSNGPAYWSQTFPNCSGSKQSPVAIDTRKVRNGKLSGLQLVNYERPVTRAEVRNTGETVFVEIMDGVTRSMMVEGMKYDLRQVHFHWGWKRYDGTEHQVNGKKYAMEAHFVHTRTDRKVAVIGVFLEESPYDNKYLSPIANLLRSIPFRDDVSQLRNNLYLRKLLPNNVASFYRYAGSFTTPPCTEVVAWTLLKDRGYIGRGQLRGFRKLYSAPEDEATAGCRISGNVRPLQPINGRDVFFAS